MFSPQFFQGKARAWMGHHEGKILCAFFVLYAVLLFGVHGKIEVSNDNPPYTDPAVNFIQGNGFTSTCWYAQGGDSFWAGNVPLHQFLLIPWLKIFGIHYYSVLGINFLYVISGMTLLWLAVRRSAFISAPEWRLGAVAFFLFTDSAYYLLTCGRYDPLSLFLVAVVCWLLTVRKTKARLAGLGLAAVLIPWAHLGTVLFTAIMGTLLLLFFPRRFWKEVLVFGLGGAIGAAGLFIFYHHFSVWDAFMASTFPHMKGSLGSGDQPWKRGGLFGFDLPFLAVAAAVLCVRWILSKKGLNFPFFVLISSLAIPAFFLFTGVFSCHYGWFLRLPLVFFVFALLSREAAWARFSMLLAALTVGAVMVMPADFVRKTVKNRLMILRSVDPGKQMADFSARLFKPSDRVWVAEDFYYEAKNRGLETFSGPVVFTHLAGDFYTGDKAYLDRVTIYLWKGSPGSLNRVKELPGQWKETGEKMKAFENEFTVFRRSDLLEQPQ